MEKERIHIYDNLKFFLILCVVLGHCMEPYVDSSNALKAAFVFIYSFHMPAFIFVSGLFSRKTIQDPVRCRQRILYFLVIYLALKIARMLLNLVLENHLSFHLFWEDGLPWFMFVLAAHYGITRFFQKIPFKWLLAGSIGLAFLAGYDSKISDYLCLSRIIAYYPFFLMGYGLDYRKVMEKAKSGKAKVIGGAGILILFCLAFLKTGTFYQFRPLLTGRNSYQAVAESVTLIPHAYLMGGPMRILLDLFISLVLIGLVAYTPNREIPLVTVWGQRTLPVYFFHLLLITALRKTVFFSYFTEHFHGIPLLLIFALMALAITILFSLPLFNRPFGWLTKQSKGWLHE